MDYETYATAFIAIFVRYACAHLSSARAGQINTLEEVRPIIVTKRAYQGVSSTHTRGHVWPVRLSASRHATHARTLLL